MNIFEVKDKIDFKFSWTYDGLFSDDYVILANYIEKHARPWLTETASIDKLLYRGVHSSPTNVYAYRTSVRTDRQPKDSTLFAHNIMNTIFKVAGATANRSNSIFTTFHRSHTFDYGETYGVIPLGDFSYTWSPIISDWYSDVNEFANYGYFLRDDVNPIAQEVEEMRQRRIQSLEAAIAEYKSLLASKSKSSREAAESSIADLQGEIDILDSPLSRREYFQVHAPTVNRSQIPWEEILLDPANYDRAKLKQFLRIDEGIKEASQTSNEIMVHCDSVLYVESAVLHTVMDLIRGRLDTGSPEFVERHYQNKHMLRSYYNHDMGGIRRSNDPNAKAAELDEGKFRNAALAGIASASVVGALTSPTNKVDTKFNNPDMSPQIAQRFNKAFPSIHSFDFGDYDDDDDGDVDEQDEAIFIEMQMRFLATAIAKKYRINAELSYEIVELAHKHADEVFPKAIDILAVIAVESSFNPRAVSKLRRDPARGLMQVRPGVWGIRPEALNDIETQIQVGVRILKKYYGRAGSAEGALHAYNIGITNYRRGNTNPAYVQKVRAVKTFLISALEQSSTGETQARASSGREHSR